MKLRAQRLQLERRLTLCDPEVATVNSFLDLTVGSSSKEKSTVTGGPRWVPALKPAANADQHGQELYFMDRENHG